MLTGEEQQGPRQRAEAMLDLLSVDLRPTQQHDGQAALRGSDYGFCGIDWPRVPKLRIENHGVRRRTLRCSHEIGQGSCRDDLELRMLDQMSGRAQASVCGCQKHDPQGVGSPLFAARLAIGSRHTVCCSRAD